MNVAEIQVIREGMLDLQVCVPKGLTDKQVEAGVNEIHPAGTEHGWKIRKDEKLLAGHPYRNTCANDSTREHITFDC